MTRTLAVVVGVLVLLGAVILGVRSCSTEDAPALSSDGSAGNADSSAPSGSDGGTPAPTGPSLEEEQLVWAGEFCRSRQALTDSVTSLGSGLDYEFGADRSVLEQLDRQIRMQVLGIASAAGDLGGLLAQAPVEPAQANDWVMAIAVPAERAQASVDEVTTRLDAMLSADGFLAGVGEAGGVLTAGAEAVTAGQDLIAAVQETSTAAQAEFADAFAAAPDCQER